MKPFNHWMIVATIGSLLWIGCGKKEAAPPPPPTPAATAPKAPAGAADLVAQAKDGIAQAMALAKAGKYQEALTSLQNTSASVKANADASKLVNDATAQVKQMAAAAGTKAATDKVGGALSGLGK